jgi:hypothetical protein
MTPLSYLDQGVELWVVRQLHTDTEMNKWIYVSTNFQNRTT